MSKPTSTTDKTTTIESAIPRPTCPPWCSGEIHREWIEPADTTSHSRSTYAGTDPRGEYLDVRIDMVHNSCAVIEGTCDTRDGCCWIPGATQITLAEDGKDGIAMSTALARSIAAALVRAADVVEQS